MKLYFCRCVGGNVGDDLNEWLWPKILGDYLDEDKEHLFLGIGSILNERVPKASVYTVLGTGLAGNPPDMSDADWRILALRGPFSRDRLRAREDLPLLDGAYLSRPFFNPSDGRRSSVGYIPHHRSMRIGQWEVVCGEAGIKLIDPRLSVEAFMEELLCCDRVVSEAMHGAILADAFDIPWIGVRAHSHINEFKWKDWGGSLGFDVELESIPPTWLGESHLRLKQKLKNFVKRSASMAGVERASWTPIETQRRPSTKAEIGDAVRRLVEIANSSRFMLSDAKVREGRIAELRDVIASNFQ